MEEASESGKQLKGHLREQIVELVKEQRISLIEQEFKFHDNPNKKKEVNKKNPKLENSKLRKPLS